MERLEAPGVAYSERPVFELHPPAEVIHWAQRAAPAKQKITSSNTKNGLHNHTHIERKVQVYKSREYVQGEKLSLL